LVQKKEKESFLQIDAVDVSSEEGDGKSWARKMLLGTPTEEGDEDVKDVSSDSFKSV
jgi:hypothetical protein